MPQLYFVNNTPVIFPKDSQGNGTWIAMAGKEMCLCLLNGGFEKHVSIPPYRKSRGLVLLDFFSYDNTTDFVTHYDFSGIEPFTMLIIQVKDTASLIEIRWDGDSTHVIPKEVNRPHIWSSATLYSQEIRKKREQCYSEFLTAHPICTREDLYNFHLLTEAEDPINGLRIKRSNLMETVSITSINSSDVGDYSMTYKDLILDKLQSYRLF